MLPDIVDRHAVAMEILSALRLWFPVQHNSSRLHIEARARELPNVLQVQPALLKGQLEELVAGPHLHTGQVEVGCENFDLLCQTFQDSW